MQSGWDQNTPVITEHTKHAKGDPNEILLDNSEISDDESSDDIDQKEHK